MFIPNYKLWKILRRQRENTMPDNNRAYRRVVIINRKTDKVIMDKCLIGPIKSENHLREIFANNASLKGISGDDLEVKAFTVVEFRSNKE